MDGESNGEVQESKLQGEGAQGQRGCAQAQALQVGASGDSAAVGVGVSADGFGDAAGDNGASGAMGSGLHVGKHVGVGVFGADNAVSAPRCHPVTGGFARSRYIRLVPAFPGHIPSYTR